MKSALVSGAMDFLHLTFVFLGFFTPYSVFPTRVSSGAQIRKAFVMEYFETCDNKVYPMMLENFTLIRNGTYVLLSGETIVTRDLKSPISFQVRMHRCKEKSNIDTCQFFTTLKWQDLCTAVQIVPFLKLMHQSQIPPMPCPPKKNHYFLKSARAKVDLIAAFLDQGSGTASLIRTQTLLFEGTQLIGCQNVGLRIADVKIRS